MLEERRFGMTGREFIVGNVTDVFDGETIRLTVERTGVFAKPQIEKRFTGKQVLCLVKSRDQGGKIIADVQLM